MADRSKECYKVCMVDPYHDYGELTYAECVKLFGEEEFEEIIQGYLPHIVAVEV